MKVRPLRSFKRDVKASFRFEQEARGTDAANRWARAADRATAGLAATPPGFAGGYALAHDNHRLPGGPYRVKMFGVGRAKSHRVVFRVVEEDGEEVIELVAVRHLAQDDLAAGDL